MSLIVFRCILIALKFSEALVNGMDTSEANQRLKNGRCGVSIQRRGDRLYLRATLPPKPGSSKEQNHQQEISLGIYANKDGVKRAYSEALRLSSDVALGRFSWGDWGNVAPSQPALSCGDWVRKFEADYWARRERNPKSESTWRYSYAPFLALLPESAPLNKETLMMILGVDRSADRRRKHQEPNTRSRSQCCMVFNALCRYAGLDIDLSPYRGNYNVKRAAPRDIPSDEEIEEWRSKIINPAWQWAYGMIAAYGLRNHEVFLIDVELLRSGDPYLQLTGGKTGERRCLPIPSKWVEDFDLFNVKIPPCSGPNNRALGGRVTQYFRRAGVPFSPYVLRHAWAVRATVAGLPTKIAAELQGHSAAVHEEVYQSNIGSRHLLEAWKRLEDK